MFHTRGAMKRAHRVRETILIGALGLLGGVLGPIGCGGEAAADPFAGQKTRQATGSIVSFSEDRRVVKIAHDDIEGFMDAMTMPFEFEREELAEGLKVGDTLSFTFAMNRAGTLVIRSVKRSD